MDSDCNAAGPLAFALPLAAQRGFMRLNGGHGATGALPWFAQAIGHIEPRECAAEY